MEGSAGGKKPVDQSDPKVIFGNAGLPPKAGAAWMKRLDFTGNYKRDTAAAGRFWRQGAEFLGKLPRKPLRNKEQKLAAEIILFRTREARERFLGRHAETVYRKLTKNLASFVRVEELVYEAAKLVPGLTPTQKQVTAEAEFLQSEKDGVEVDQGIFLAH